MQVERADPADQQIADDEIDEAPQHVGGKRAA